MSDAVEKVIDAVAMLATAQLDRIVKAAELSLRSGNISATMTKELELIKPGEKWQTLFFGGEVTIVSSTGKTADDTVTFDYEGRDYTFSLPRFLGTHRHPSLIEDGNEEKDSTEENPTPEQDAASDVADLPAGTPKTFGFKKARELMKQGRWVTRMCSDDAPITIAGDNSIVSSVGADVQVCLTGEDITASDWVEVKL